MSEAFLKGIEGGLERLRKERSKLASVRFGREEDDEVSVDIREIDDEIRRLEQYRRDHGK